MNLTFLWLFLEWALTEALVLTAAITFGIYMAVSLMAVIVQSMFGES